MFDTTKRERERERERKRMFANKLKMNKAEINVDCFHNFFFASLVWCLLTGSTLNRTTCGHVSRIMVGAAIGLTKVINVMKEWTMFTMERKAEGKEAKKRVGTTITICTLIN
jgi:hypothetical protein